MIFCAFACLFGHGKASLAQDWIQTSAPISNWVAVASSADGARLVAAAGGFSAGRIHTSTNHGSTWTVTSAPSANWEALASSADGSTLVATVDHGYIYTSTDSGTNWRVAAVPNLRWWSAACSADGTRLVAVPFGGSIYTSSDSGATWIKVSSAPDAYWNSVASSADGTHLVAVQWYAPNGSDPGGIFVSSDSGGSWFRTSAPSATWGACASSADGSRIVASSRNPGSLYLSDWYGSGWAPLTINYSPPSWGGRTLASSADGRKWLAVNGTSIYRSLDWGATWISNNAPNLAWASVATSADGSELVAVGSNGGIYHKVESGPELSISDTLFVEGNIGTNNMVFTVLLSTNHAQSASVHFTTVNGSAIAGSDYITTNGTLIFPPDETNKTITVPVVGDRLSESNEAFFIKLSNPTNLLLQNDQATGTIINDEPRLQIVGVTLIEGDSGLTNAVFVALLSSPYSEPVSVDFSTVDGSAVAGNDYMATNGTLIFAPGETNKWIVVPVVGELSIEGDETFSVLLTNASPNLFLSNSQATGTIRSDDYATLIITQPESQTVRIGDNATFSVYATGGWPFPLRYQWAINGKDIPGATNDTFSLAGVQPSNDGSSFRVLVTGQRIVGPERCGCPDRSGRSALHRIAQLRRRPQLPSDSHSERR